jgi:LmbE family N-acetylglucosaminyl deacetylase
MATRHRMDPKVVQTHPKTGPHKDHKKVLFSLHLAIYQEL